MATGSIGEMVKQERNSVDRTDSQGRSSIAERKRSLHLDELLFICTVCLQRDLAKKSCEYSHVGCPGLETYFIDMMRYVKRIITLWLNLWKGQNL
ncbi:hypothetical protein DUI87_18237 [Hirundo rustica rustica]|uniref:Uncharacterized protein n=1 Tax=Hirundo rustica rustica TaxID=333673 RepID=A0A3M0JVP3_HIRRU|nr:hypothetical protein DUI87_18237 [Hirundo rustica rustica]